MSLTLHQFPPAFGLPFSVSPFCAKLEAYLRTAGVDYTCGPPRLPSAPKKKVPFIACEGEVVGDSQHAIEWCKARFGDPLDAALSDEQRNRGVLVQRTVEDHLYFALVYSRWQDPRGWAQLRPVVDQLVPAPLRFAIVPMIRRATVKQLWSEGTGRHTPEQVYAAGAADLRAVSQVLGDKPFLLGDSPTSFDCAAFGQIAGVLSTDSGNALTAAARADDNLVAWHERMLDRVGWS